MSQVTDSAAGMCPADIGRVRQLGDPRVSPDGSAVAFTVTDPDLEGNRYTHRIWLVPARGAGSSPRPFTGPGSEQLPRWSPDGRRLAFAVTGDDGRSQICVLPVADGGERLVVCGTEAPVTELAWAPDGHALAFAARDPDPARYGRNGEQRRDKDMPPRRISGLLYRFVDDFQLQAVAGFGVPYCNPRGSAGYSEQWGRAIRGPECAQDPGTGWGGADYADVMACVETACQRFGWIDPGRLGILGGSYGGFMTSWAIGHTSRFRAACSERACNNLLTMEHSADVPGFARSYVGPDHLTDPGAYLRHSPVSYVRDMTTPLLILHSEDDLRCPIGQAEELFVALRLLGRDPVMYRFPGENHELTRCGAPEHRVRRAELILAWFRQHLYS